MDMFDNAINEICKNSSKNEIPDLGRFAWSDLVKKYPNKWLIVKDIDMVDDDRIFMCNLIEVCSHENKSSRRLYYLNKNIKVTAIRAESDEDVCMGGWC